MSQQKKAAIFLFDRVEECEALIVVDLLRRADIRVDMVSIESRLEITGSHNIRITADLIFDETNLESYDILILPGGEGVFACKDHVGLCESLKERADQNGYIAAICAAPSILAKLGILTEKPATCYPGVKDILPEYGAMYVDMPVTVADRIITGRALGSAIPFAVQIIAKLLSQDEAEKVLSKICYLSN